MTLFLVQIFLDEFFHVVVAEIIIQSSIACKFVIKVHFSVALKKNCHNYFWSFQRDFTNTFFCPPPSPHLIFHSMHFVIRNHTHAMCNILWKCIYCDKDSYIHVGEKIFFRYEYSFSIFFSDTALRLRSVQQKERKKRIRKFPQFYVLGDCLTLDIKSGCKNKRFLCLQNGNFKLQCRGRQ